MRHSSSKPCVTCPIRVLCLHLRVPRWSLINESLKFEHAFRLSSHRQAIIVKLQAASLDCTEMIQNLAVVCCCPLGTTSGEKKLKLCGCGCAEGPNLSHDHKIAQPSKRWEKDRKSDLPSLPPQTFTTIYKLSAKKGNWKSILRGEATHQELRVLHELAQLKIRSLPARSARCWKPFPEFPATKAFPGFFNSSCSWLNESKVLWMQTYGKVTSKHNRLSPSLSRHFQQTKRSKKQLVFNLSSHCLRLVFDVFSVRVMSHHFPLLLFKLATSGNHKCPV